MDFRSTPADLEVPERAVAAHVLELAAARGDRVALIDAESGRRWSHGELLRHSIRVARGLDGLGVGPRDVVALVSPNSLESVAAFLGAMAAGATVTTANPSYTADELRRQLLDSRARAVFTTDAKLDVLREAAGPEMPVVTLDDGGRAIDLASFPAADDRLPDPGLDPARDLAVLPYSSGTTGLPKGVMLTHRNLVANIEQVLATRNIDSCDVMLGLLPFFHIYGMVAVLLTALRAGATLVVMGRYDLDHLLRTLAVHRVTFANLVPPILVSLANEPRVDVGSLSVRRILSGGAPLSAELAARVAARLGCQVGQGYGLTETSPVTHCPVAGDAPAGSSGYAVPGTVVRIVDLAGGGPLGVGEDGEIRVRGPQVMRGYLGADEATRDAFDADGFFRTGDVGHVDADGALHVVDRVKELIKVNGMQVAPAELEALLLAHDAVADAAVVGAPDDACGEVPVGFVVLTPDAAATDRDGIEADLAAHVAAHAAPHKRIRRFEIVAAIPKSASGKILRRELRERSKSG